MRPEPMVSEYSTKEIMKNMDDDLKVRMKGKGAGKFRVKQMAVVNAHDIRAFVREYEINTEVKVDAILVDYLT